MRRLAKGAAELATEMGAGEAGCVRHIRHAQRLEVHAVGEILGEKEVTGGRNGGHDPSIEIGHSEAQSSGPSRALRPARE